MIQNIIQDEKSIFSTDFSLTQYYYFFKTHFKNQFPKNQFLKCDFFLPSLEINLQESISKLGFFFIKKTHFKNSYF